MEVSEIEEAGQLPRLVPTRHLVGEHGGIGHGETIEVDEIFGERFENTSEDD